ncbi:ribonuclease H-like domain-containing protein, partial [Tanacetum coccineum]
GNVRINSESNAQGNLPQNISQGQPDLRRSSRVPKVSAKFNDYVVNSSKKYGLEKYVTYTNLNTSNYCFSINLNKSSEPTSYFKVVKNPNWIEVMNNEIEALNRNNTWTIRDLPKGRKAVGAKLWKIKYKSTGEIKRYKARVVAKGFSQREGFDYLETFSHVVKMSTVRCMLNVAICNGWDLFQLDINNGFLYGDLSEDVYMTLPPGFDIVKSKICKLNKSLYGLKQAPSQWNSKLTQALTKHGFVYSKFDYSLFTKNSDNVFIILIVYVDDIVVTGNNYMHSPLNSHLDAALRVLRYLKGSPGSENLFFGYCVFLGDSLVTYKSKKQSTLSKSSAKAEYRNMTSATCKVIWLSNLLGDMCVKNLLPVVMYCDNSFALQIAANHVFHEKSKHFEIDVHLVREKVASGVIKNEKIHTTQQIADILTKGLDIKQHKILCGKHGMLDMFKLEKA